MPNEKQVAREWLYFVGAFAFGVAIWPALFLLLADNNTNRLPLFYEGLLGGTDAVLCWLFALAPYVAVQLCRSVMWAVKKAR